MATNHSWPRQDHSRTGLDHSRLSIASTAWPTSSAALSPDSGRAGDHGRRQHGQEIAWECLAGMPVLEADDVAVRRVGLAQAGRDLLGNDGGGVVALEAQPGDVGFRVVVTIDLHRYQATCVARG